MMAHPLLSIADLNIAFRTPWGLNHAVQSLSYDVYPGEILGIVGESGCGKSVSSLAIMGLLPQQGQILRGSIAFEGQETLRLNKEQHRLLRAKKLGMIFQNPMSSLNPYLTVATQMIEASLMLEKITPKAARKRAHELLERVQISEAARRLNQYPHELSGGMCQRVMIAMTLMNRPRLLIADEPTTALDVTVQTQILSILSELIEKPVSGIGAMSIILISHDIGVIANMADRMLVMYAGMGIETGPTPALLAQSRHPYTQGLFESIPDLEGPIARLPSIPGAPPQMNQTHQVCPYVDRCPRVQNDCRLSVPGMTDALSQQRYRCFHPVEYKTQQPPSVDKGERRP